jgi:hypothetical protein
MKKVKKKIKEREEKKKIIFKSLKKTSFCI